MNCIILTAQEAAAVRGETTPYHLLEPVLLADGATYVVPVRVLADPAHAKKFSALSGKTQRDVADTEFASYVAPEPEPPPIYTLTIDAGELASLKAVLSKQPDAVPSLVSKVDQLKSPDVKPQAEGVIG